MTTVKSFSQLGIKSKTLAGDKITLTEILDQQVIVCAYRIEDSKYGKRDAKCLHLQIEINNEKRVLFTGSTVLMDTLEKIPEASFPFSTTIVKEMDWYKFT